MDPMQKEVRIGGKQLPLQTKKLIVSHPDLRGQTPKEEDAGSACETAKRASETSSVKDLDYAEHLGFNKHSPIYHPLHQPYFSSSNHAYRTPLRMNQGGPHIVNKDHMNKLVTEEDTMAKVSAEFEQLQKKGTYSVAMHMKNSSFNSKNKTRAPQPSISE